MLSAAREPGDRARRALERLCEAYWFPLYAFVRGRGHSREDAEDLVQLFFLRLVETRFIDAAQRGAGRFRTFLLHAMKQFLSDRRRRESALKRGGGKTPIRIDAASAEGRYAGLIADRRTPEQEFEHQWALTVLDRVLESMEREARRRGRSEEFRLLSPFLTDGSPQRSYRDVAAELGISEGAVKVAVLRLRRRFGRRLREVVADTVEGESEIDDEIRRLLGALSP